MDVDVHLNTLLETFFQDKPTDIHLVKIFFDYIKNLKEPKPHLIFDSFKRIKGVKDLSDEQLLYIISLFCNINPPLLESRYEILIEKNEQEEFYDISKTELRDILNTGYFIHPESGEKIYNYKDYVFVYFVPGKYFYANEQ